jgi:hypothetical protein
MVNLGTAVGRPIVGFYSDSVGSINMAADTTLFGSLVCFLVWIFAESYGVLILAVILGGRKRRGVRIMLSGDGCLQRLSGGVQDSVSVSKRCVDSFVTLSLYEWMALEEQNRTQHLI